MEGQKANQATGTALAAKPSTVLVVNTLSRRGADLFRRAHRRLKDCGVDLSASYPIRNQDDLIRAVKAALKDDATTRIVVGGGDGTISTVADAIAHRDITLGVLPLGTGNDFTRIMGVPLDLPGACQVITGGSTRTVNLGRVNGRYFLNTVLIGFPAHINHSVPGWAKRFLGKTAYPLAASAALLQPRPFRANIAVDGKRHELETSLVVLGNGRFHPPVEALPETERVDLDRLVVQVPRDGTAGLLFRLGLEYLRTGQLNPALLLTLSGREVVVETDRPQEIDVDGVFAGWTPASAVLAPGALRVIVPSSGDDESAAGSRDEPGRKAA